MKKTLIVLAILGLVLLPTSKADAIILDFEDIPGFSYRLLTNTSYKGFDWSALPRWYVGDTSVSNYGGAAHSGRQYLSNGFGTNNLMVTRATSFTFNGAWFAYPTHSRPATTIQVFGLASDNSVLFQTGVIANSSVPHYVQADWANVYGIKVQHTGGSTANRWWTLDDFTYDEEIQGQTKVDPPIDENTVIPEPASMLLFGSGLVGLIRLRRKN